MKCDRVGGLAVEYSRYQQAIFDFVQKGSGDLVINATAGSGKTFTLVEIAKRLHSERVCFLAFNKHIVEELQKRLPSTIAVKTIHSLGYSALLKTGKKFKAPNDSKYRKICGEIAIRVLKITDISLRFTITQELKEISRFARLSLTDPSNTRLLLAMIARFELEVTEPKLVLPYIGEVLEKGERIARYSGEIDFTDMIWLPHLWHLKTPTYDVVLVDEAQDLNEAQLQLVQKCRGRGGRLIFCGDENQAIMAFAGANCDSMERIMQATKATVLPLSICYRCPVSHVNLARRIVPEIEPAPGAIEGIIEIIQESEISYKVQEGDLILCRMTAPLVSLCIDLIRQTIPARVKGRDISKQLTAVVQDIAAQPGFRYARFGHFLVKYQSDKTAKLEQREDSEQAIESLADKCNGIYACYESLNCKDVGDLCEEIEELFSDDRPSVQLSTVHRAKGLENERVFIVKPDKLPLKWKGQTEEQLIQELNLKFVALTRAKKALFFVEDEKSRTKTRYTPDEAT